MKLSGMSFFQLASQRMSWLGARQAVISENIANADTPDYRAKEVSGFSRMLEARPAEPGAGGDRRAAYPQHRQHARRGADRE